MARSMIAANAAIFATLSKVIGGRINDEIAAKKRAVATNAAEKKWLKNCTVDADGEIYFSPHVRIVPIEHEARKYVAAIGVDVKSVPPELIEESLNAGLFTALLFELKITPLAPEVIGISLEEYVFFPSDNEVEKYELELIEKYFPQIRIFSAIEDSSVSKAESSVERTATLMLLCSRQLRQLDWSTGSEQIMAEVARSPDILLPWHLAIRALTETNWDSSFLALYRCIEQLFPLPKMSALKEAMKLAESGIEIAEILEKHLGWRHKEEDAIIHLFSDLEESIVKQFCVVAGIPETSSKEAIARRVYAIRNSCVHFRAIHRSAPLIKRESWAGLIEAMLATVKALYGIHSAALTPVIRA